MSAISISSESQESFGLRVWTGYTQGMGRGHRHHDLELNYVRQGQMTYLMGGELLTLPQARLCALWGDAVHQSLPTDKPASVIWVTVPLRQVLEWQLPAALINRLFERGYAVDPQPMAGDRELLRLWGDDLAQADARRTDLVLREIEARLLRLALALDDSGPPEQDAPVHRRPWSADWAAVARMVRYIGQHHAQHEPVRVEQIAGAAHLHPNYAMTVFRRRTGMTINEYLTRQRVAHAQRLLATTTRSVVRIGFDSGFGSTSRFYEAFKRQTGCSPRQFRVKLTGD